MDTKKTLAPYWGFDTTSIDRTVAPQDDFYQYANGAWLKTNSIPPDESRWGSFTMLRHKTEEQLHALVTKIEKTKNVPEGSSKRLVRDMYVSASDMSRRNALGTTPVSVLRDMVRGAVSVEDLIATVAHLHTLGISGFWSGGIDQDSKDSSVYRFHLWQGGLGLPDCEYYLLDKPEQKRVRLAYQKHIRTLASIFDLSKKEVLHMVKVVMHIETLLAEASMRKEDTRDVEKVYHKFTTKKLQNISPNIPWKVYFKGIGAQEVRTLIVGQPTFFGKISALLGSVPLADWKVYLEWQVLLSTASSLSDSCVEANFNFFGKVLAGSTQMKPLWRRALGATSGVVGEALGSLYVEAYFPEKAKKAMDQLVSDLFVVYADRIKKLSWMTSATKSRALDKLKAMKRKIGYPTRVRGYKGLVISPDDFFGNIMRSNLFEHGREMKKLKRPIDRTEWHMRPHTVNAYFSFNMNEIVFPAAILQWPFFDFKADDAVNYAAIGSVIGHEMTHGFDDQGSKFDGAGNMKSWWTKKDREQFMQKASLLVAQYDQYEAASGVIVNGQLTLGENIADLGGLCIAFDAYQKRLAKTGRKTIDGFSPEERFFLGFAQMERELARPEHVKMAALTDPHAPAQTRINGPLANFKPFYDTYQVLPNHALYKKPESFVEVW